MWHVLFFKKPTGQCSCIFLMIKIMQEWQRPAPAKNCSNPRTCLWIWKMGQYFVFVLTKALGKKKKSIKLILWLCRYRCVSVFLDGEQSVCHFICDSEGMTTTPPKRQGTHFAQQQLQMKQGDTVTFVTLRQHTGNTLATQRKEMGISWLFQEDTNLWRDNEGHSRPCRRKGNQVGNVSKWALSGSPVK